MKNIIGNRERDIIDIVVVNVFLFENLEKLLFLKLILASEKLKIIFK